MSLAERYAELRTHGRLHERMLLPPARQPNELELQARWFAGDFGRRFRSVDGREIEVIQFGTWNREAGPDFHSAAIRIDGGEIASGSIEFDLTDRSWETHGHAINPAFEDTVLHVFVHAGGSAFFSRTASNRNVLQVRVDQTALPDAFAANIPLARPGRCQAPLKNLPEDRIRGIVAAAASFRQQRKTARLRAMSETHGRDEALFQELAAALGYKQNKLPFTVLAQRLPVAFLRTQEEDAEALLFGIAGFLDAPDLAVYEDESRTYVRRLWDRWWRRRDELQRLVLPAKTWQLSGARPLNHPQRRLGALAAIVRSWPQFLDSLGAAAPVAATRSCLLSLSHPFWSRHYTLNSEAAPAEMAIIGESRVSEILANVIIPFLSAEGADLTAEYAKLPARLSNRRLETAITRLFGDDPRRAAFVKTIAQQQGLLQIYEDFCLQDNSDCAHCPFPEQMQRWA